MISKVTLLPEAILDSVKDRHEVKMIDLPKMAPQEDDEEEIADFSEMLPLKGNEEEVRKEKDKKYRL